MGISDLKKLIKEILNVALAESYRFEDFEQLGDREGFHIPSDVYYGTIYLGTIESEPEGYRIVFIDSTDGKVRIKRGTTNSFKSKNLAAETLHRAWKIMRNKQPATL